MFQSEWWQTGWSETEPIVPLACVMFGCIVNLMVVRVLAGVLVHPMLSFVLNLIHSDLD